MTDYGKTIITGNGTGYFKRTSEAHPTIVVFFFIAVGIVLLMNQMGLNEIAPIVQHVVTLALTVWVIVSAIYIRIQRSRASKTEITVHEKAVSGYGLTGLRLYEFALPYDQITYTTFIKEHPLNLFRAGGAKSNTRQYIAVIIHSSHGKFTCYCDLASEIAKVISERKSKTKEASS